jgi:aminoglycoside/choline kinase family phosphotransferase
MQLSPSDAVKLRDNGYDWIHVAALLADEGILVPGVIATLPEFASLIIEDYGNVQLEDRVRELMAAGNSNETRRLYHQALGIIEKFSHIQPNPNSVWCTRAFDAERFAWELDFFKKHYLDAVLKLSLSDDEWERFRTESQRLASFLGQYSRYFVHRDYHSRNLMVERDRLAVLDFQDARLGPLAYDLVSLVFDGYVPLSPAMRLDLLAEGMDVVTRRLGDNGRREIREHWKAMLLQRQLKAIGSFGYLTLVKGRRNYLQYVAAALQTLDTASVADDRWPLLSGKLLELMRASVPAGG